MYNRYISRSEPERVEEQEERRTSGAETALGGVLESVRSLLGRIRTGGDSLFAGIPLLEKLDSGDLLLILVLIFLFRESEDEEWLIILALVLLMGL